jgi:hypothetical protein
MGNCSSPRRKIPIPPRKGSSTSMKSILLDNGNNKVNSFKRALSKEETSSTTKAININIDSNIIKNKDNNEEEKSIISESKKQKKIIIKFNSNKSKNNSIKSKSKQKLVNNIKNIKKLIINRNNYSDSKTSYIHVKNRSSSSKYDSSSMNSSIHNNYNSSQLTYSNNNSKIYFPNKIIKMRAKCKNKNKIPRSTFDSNNSNFSSISNRNYKLKFSKLYNNTYNSEMTDENINIINKNIYNIYNNNNININVYSTKNSNYSNKKNKNIYKCIK